MYLDNRTTFIRRDIIAQIAKLYFEGALIEQIDKLPIKMIKNEDTPNRCCIYKDREMIKYRAIAIMGFSLENEYEIDNNLLSDYAKIALKRENPTFPILTFIDDACRSCIRTNYFITNVCRNCVAKPCIVNCPKKSIFVENNQAKIDANTCVNCGICMKVCPYHAVVYVPVPREESCPVDAIIKDEKGKEDIDYSKCIFCGKCARSCPFGAIMEKSQIIDVIKHIKNGSTIVAMIAPSIVAQFEVNLNKIVGAIKEIGFSNVVECALGADITAKTEAMEFLERIEKGDKLMGTSCCPAYTEAVKKHSTDFIPFVSHAKTPMKYTADIVNKKFPNSVKVFIGPCIAKKHEGLDYKNIDYVLTYEELSALFIARDIDLKKCEEKPLDLKKATNIGRGFPATGGVSQGVEKSLKNGDVELKPALIDGFTRQNVRMLNVYAKGNCPGNLVEVMSREGGCIAGPGVIMKYSTAKKKLEDFIK